MAIDHISELNLSSTEYCFLVDKQYFNNSSFMVRHPKLMPLINSSPPPKTVNNIYNTNIFVNDKQCKPNITSRMITQNYITVKRSVNCSLSHLAIPDDENRIPNNTRLKCSCYNNDPKDLTIIDG